MDIFQLLAGIASIISIPLAIYYARKNNSTSSEKARLDIIKTLSYKLSAVFYLTAEDINSVYNSKLREHKITHIQFNQEDILNDLKSDIMSNAFLSNDIRNTILYNLSTVEFPHDDPLNSSTYRFLIPFINFFLSPIPYILFIANIIICIFLLCPYIISTIYYYLKQNDLDNDYIYITLLSILDQNITTRFSLVTLLILFIVCILRKKYKKHLD